MSEVTIPVLSIPEFSVLTVTSKSGGFPEQSTTLKSSLSSFHYSSNDTREELLSKILSKNSENCSISLLSTTAFSGESSKFSIVDTFSVKFSEADDNGSSTETQVSRGLTLEPLIPGIIKLFEDRRRVYSSHE